jgi:signal peptidase I
VQTSPETRIVPATPKGGRGRPQRSQQSHLWREILETVLLTALVYFVVRASVQFTPIEGPSMQPGLHDGQSVIVYELAYLFGNPQRGDVIVFRHSPTEQFIKRIIAVPGDTITVTDTAVIVDGVTLHEPYINSQGSDQNVGLLPETKIAPGDYFVMGDNRNNSEDSRAFGPVHRQAIVGKADLVIWPLNTLHWIPTHREVFAGVHP